VAYRREQFAEGEWYHCYGRGVDKRRVFETKRDYQRFLETLYVSNDTEPTNRDNFKHLSHEHIFDLPRLETVVDIGAFCLMPNHFHLLLKETREGGITKFMRKVGTAYTMYFNISRTRIGNLFVKPFRSRHIGDDRYFRRALEYIHLNPAELYEPGWKEGRVSSIQLLDKKLLNYQYSSLVDYENTKTERVQKNILCADYKELYPEDAMLLRARLAEAGLYYQDLAQSQR
jgi:putative transposase